ncbi:hypothetical protein [Peijinzhouia sedimentorum]
MGDELWVEEEVEGGKRMVDGEQPQKSPIERRFRGVFFGLMEEWLTVDGGRLRGS